MASTTTPKRTLVVYQPTVTGLPPMRAYVRNLWHRRPLIWHLARTNLKAQHYDTVLGKVWLLLDPILMAFTFYLVRVVLRPKNMTDEQRQFLIAHLIMGITFFEYVRDLVIGTARSIINNKNMVLNTPAPRGVFPVVSLTSAALTLLPGLVVYFGVHLWTEQPWTIHMLWLPVVLLLLTMFALGFGLVWVPLVTFFRDTGTLFPYLMRVWLFLTPVMYSVAEIPAGVAPILRFNPLYPCFAVLENIFTGHPPETIHLLVAAGWGFGMLLVGSIAFLIREPDYAVRL